MVSWGPAALGDRWGNGSVLRSTVGHSLWGVPGWLKDSMGVFGDWGVPSSAPLTLGKSLGEDWTELCRSELLAQLWLFGCSMARGPSAMRVLPDVDTCPHHGAKPGSANVGMELGEGRGGKPLPIPKAAILVHTGFWGQVSWLYYALNCAPWLCKGQGVSSSALPPLWAEGYMLFS